MPVISTDQRGKKLNMQLPYNPAIALLGIIAEKWKPISIQKSISNLIFKYLTSQGLHISVKGDAGPDLCPVLCLDNTSLSMISEMALKLRFHLMDSGCLKFCGEKDSKALEFQSQQEVFTIN